jgi:hypothetical protein
MSEREGIDDRIETDTANQRDNINPSDASNLGNVPQMR